MKKFLSAALIVLIVTIFLPAMTCEALDYQSVSVTHLKWIVGNWYDTKGNLVLTISNDYKINGCAVMAVDFVGDTAGMYKVKIDEGNRYRTIELMYGESRDSSDHEILMLNNGIITKLLFAEQKSRVILNLSAGFIWVWTKTKS